MYRSVTENVWSSNATPIGTLAFGAARALLDPHFAVMHSTTFTGSSSAHTYSAPVKSNLVPQAALGGQKAIINAHPRTASASKDDTNAHMPLGAVDAEEQGRAFGGYESDEETFEDGTNGLTGLIYAP